MPETGRALRALTLAMAKGFVRDRMTLFWAVLFPLMFLVVFGGIFTDRGSAKLDVIQVGSVPVLDRLPASATAELHKSITVTKSHDLAAATRKVRKGDAGVVVSQTGDTLTVRYSAADQVASAQALSIFGSVVSQSNVAASGTTPRFTLASHQVEDESLKTIQYVTPGLLGWAVAMSATFGAATNLVSWRKNGVLRRLRLSPAPVGSVVLARVGVSIVVAVCQAAIFVGLATAAFGLKLTGWWPMMIPVLLCGTLSFLSIGLLAGSVSRTEEGAVGLANFVVLPMAFLSGSFFPLDGAPGWLQVLSHLLPLRHLNDAMMDVMVRGEGPSAIVVPCLVLLGFTAVFTAISLRLFRWDA